jgi:thioredoxin-related protein
LRKSNHYFEKSIIFEKIFIIMKSLYILSFILVAGFQVSAQNAEKVKWHTLDEALKLNATTPRNILIDVYTDWCGWCKKMDAETFDHPVIAKYINKNFYAVKFDAESSATVKFGEHTFTNTGSGGTRKTTHQFATALGVSGYPTIVYFTGDLKLIGPVSGYYTAEKIEPLLHFIVEEKYQSISFEEYQKTFVSELKKK